MEITKKRSSNAPGSGTMIIAKIATIKKTTVKSLEPVNCDKKGEILLKKDAFCPVCAKPTPNL